MTNVKVCLEIKHLTCFVITIALPSHKMEKKVLFFCEGCEDEFEGVVNANKKFRRKLRALQNVTPFK